MQQVLSISKFYEDDYTRLAELFKSYQQRKRSDFYRAREYFDQFKFGLQRHMAWEEEVLFPYFEQKLGEHFERPVYGMKLEHRQIGRLLEMIQNKLREGDPSTDKEEQFQYGLQRHIVWEEEILFPIFQLKTDMDGPVQVLRMEHRRIQSLLNTLYEKLKKSDPTSEIEEYRLLSVIGEHNLKEELIVFPAIEAAISEQEVRDIFASMNRLPTAS